MVAEIEKHIARAKLASKISASPLESSGLYTSMRAASDWLDQVRPAEMPAFLVDQGIFEIAEFPEAHRLVRIGWRRNRRGRLTLAYLAGDGIPFEDLDLIVGAEQWAPVLINGVPTRIESWQISKPIRDHPPRRGAAREDSLSFVVMYEVLEGGRPGALVELNWEVH